MIFVIYTLQIRVTDFFFQGAKLIFEGKLWCVYFNFQLLKVWGSLGSAFIQVDGITCTVVFVKAAIFFFCWGVFALAMMLMCNMLLLTGFGSSLTFLFH